MTEEQGNAAAQGEKEVPCEDSTTDSDNEPASKPLLRRISTSKCVGRLPVVKEGYLMKQTRSFQRWQRRYFRLRGRTLYYAKDKESQLWDEYDLEGATFAECNTNNATSSFEIITSSRCLVLGAESRTEMDSWAGALRGALHRGDDVTDLLATMASGDHHWYAATHARPTFCNVCREPLGALGTAHALACELCKFKAHKRCAARAPPSCKWTTLASLGPHLVEDADGNIIMPHQWLEGNLPVAAKCDICDKTCGSVLRLQDYRCVWCRRCVHSQCRPGWRAPCSLGEARGSVVAPTRLHSVGPDGAWLPDRPVPATPLVVFVNSKSGDNQGVKFLRRFRQLLNPAQVFELSGAGAGATAGATATATAAAGPGPGLRLFRHFAPLRVLVCSGDGSVGWVLHEIDKLHMHRQVATAVLPLGTGNDLARVLGWGGRCDDAANLSALLQRYERASAKMLDRWSIMMFERAASAPPPPAAPPELVDETALLKTLHDIMQAGEVSEAARAALSGVCAALSGARGRRCVSGAAPNGAAPGAAAPGAAAPGAAAPGAAALLRLRLRRAVSRLLLLTAGDSLKHDHAHCCRCKSWDPCDTTSDSEPEAPAAEKGSIEKTEKEQYNSAAAGAGGGAGGCQLCSAVRSVRTALRALRTGTGTGTAPTGTGTQPHTEPVSCDTCTSGAETGAEAEAIMAAGAEAEAEAGALTMGLQLPVPRAFADSRRSSAASATSMQPEHIPDVDEDIAKLITSNLEQGSSNDKQSSQLSSANPQDRLSLDNLSSCDTGSCRNLFRPEDRDRSPCYSSCNNSSSLTIPNLVVSDDSDRPDSTLQGQTYESDQLTIIDIDKPYTDEIHFEEFNTKIASGECTPERKLSSDIDASSEGSNLSEDFSLMSEIIDCKPGDVGDTGDMTHIDSPEASDTYMTSETIHGESIMDDVGSMLGQEVLIAMMEKNGDNETYTDDTTLFTSDTVSDIAMDSRNPSLEKNGEAKLNYLKKVRKANDSEAEKFGYENKVFYIENTTKPEEQKKYCSLAHFEEGNDIVRRSFKKHLRKSLKKRVTEDMSLKPLLAKTAEEISDELSPVSTNPIDTDHLYKSDVSQPQIQNFPQVSVVVEPPSPCHSDDKKSIKTCTSRMASVLSDIFQGTDTLTVKTPEPNLQNRERRQSDDPRLMGSDPEYGKFLSCSPAATRRISCGSLFKPGEANKLSASASSIWGEGSMGTHHLKQDASEKVKKLPIINPLVQLPAWPHVPQGFISQCLLANADALCAAVSPLMDPPDDTLLEGFYERAVMNNYFGIGIDAKITLDFHNKREEHPEKCRSRARNYMWYGVLGSKEWVNRTYRHLGQRVQLECDGQRIPLPELQGIVVLNIPSFMGGTNFWGGTRADDIFLAPSFDDRILEVVAVFGSAQMAASRLLRLQRHRIAQCRSVSITVLGREPVPVQVDGEAWLQPPGTLRILHKNRAHMLCRSRQLETDLRTWDEKQQQKQHQPPPPSPRRQLGPGEAAQLLALLDDVNTVVKHVKLSCIRAGGAGPGPAALCLARRAGGAADALQRPDGSLQPGPRLRTGLAHMVESCQELLSSGSVPSAAAGSLRAQLARVEIIDGHAYFHPDEMPKRARWLRGRRSVSAESGPVGGSGSGTGSGSEAAAAAAVRGWGVREVGRWLERLQLGQYGAAFASHDVTGRELLSLARRDLRELGVAKVGHVRRILQARAELR